MNRRDRRIERLARRIERDTVEMAALLFFRNFEDRLESAVLNMGDMRAELDSIRAESRGGAA